MSWTLQPTLPGMSDVRAQFIALLVPPRCLVCAAPCAAGCDICSACHLGLDCLAPVRSGPVAGADRAVAAGEHSGSLRALDHALKYRRHTAAASLAASLMVRAAREDELSGTVVAVPAAPRRRLARGFDPAEELALAVAAKTGLSFSAPLVRRSGMRQVGRTRADRLADPPVVRCRGPAPRRVLLVDDIRTTGATASACCHALRAGGCDDITLMTLAVARLSRPGRGRRI